MVEISNIGPVGDNGGSGQKKTVRNNSNDTKVSAFDEYRKFQQEKLQEFENFRNQANESFENYKKEAMERFDAYEASINKKKDGAAKDADFDYAKALEGEWKMYEAKPGESFYSQPKPKTAPVYNPDAEPVKAAKSDSSDDVKRTKSDTTVHEQVKQEEKPPVSVVEREGVTGKYTLTSGANGEGFSLSTEMSVFGGGEAMKFFKGGGFLDSDIKYDKDSKMYSYRGLQSSNREILQMRMMNTAQRVSIDNAVYNDLLAKQKNGTELSDAEQSFIQSHLQNLERYGLGVDEEGNLIDKSE